MGLSREQQLALNYRWMIRAQQPLIQSAIEAGYAVYWSRNVKDVFAKNDADDEFSKRPSSWSQLGTALGLNSKHASRYSAEQDGKHGNLRGKLTIPDTLVRYRVSLVLGVAEGELSPTSREWVAESAKWLVTLNRPHLGVALDAAKLLAYADCVLAKCDDSQPEQLCDGRLAKAQHNAPGKGANEIKADILDVATVIGDILANDVGLEFEA